MGVRPVEHPFWGTPHLGKLHIFSALFCYLTSLLGTAQVTRTGSRGSMDSTSEVDAGVVGVVGVEATSLVSPHLSTMAGIAWDLNWSF